MRDRSARMSDVGLRLLWRLRASLVQIVMDHIALILDGLIGLLLQLLGRGR
jgi:hypothetical protein